MQSTQSIRSDARPLMGSSVGLGDGLEKGMGKCSIGSDSIWIVKGQALRKQVIGFFWDVRCQVWIEVLDERLEGDRIGGFNVALPDAIYTKRER